MAEVSKEQVEEALKQVIDPYLEKDLVSAHAVTDITIDGGKATVTIELPYPAKGWQDQLSQQLSERVQKVEGI